MRAYVVLALAISACSGSSPAAADPPTGWRAMAARARVVRTADAEAALGRLDRDRRAAVERVLDRMAESGLGAAALREAGALAEASAGVGNDPAWAGSGTAPGTHALYVAGLAVLAGMASASAREAPSSAAELVQTICSMPMPLHFNSGGRASDLLERNGLADDVDAALPAGAARPTRGGRCVAAP